MTEPMKSCVSEFICSLDDLVPNSGVAAIYQEQQIALFYLPDRTPVGLYAISNFDPHGKANVLSRGILGDVDGELVVASPLYKQHFSLLDGKCIENPELHVRVYDVLIRDAGVYVRGVLIE